jgi:hypothetical protein
MQGSGISSESIWTPFDATTTAFSRELKHLLKISWKRVQDANAGFATIGTSVIDGTDLVKGTNGFVANSDTYEYFDETDRVISMSYDRQMILPVGGIHTALLDVVLNNFDGRFTPDQNGTIGTAILPNRPTDAKIGFAVESQNKLIPKFKGLTKTPKDNYGDRTLSFTAQDYVKFLYDFELDSAKYTNQTTDAIITDILSTVGFGSSQYSIETGLSTITFAYFQKTQTAGARIAQLAEAEGGVFYQDETGKLTFLNRRSVRDVAFSNTVWTIELSSIIDWEEDNSAPIYNKVTVKAKPRIVQSLQEIWRNGPEIEIDPSATVTVWANFSDPIDAVTDPADTTDYTAFTATGGGGSDITSDISIVTSKFVTATKLEITNNNASKAYMNLLKLRGTPAQVKGEILEISEDASSQNKYGVLPYTVENNLIDDRVYAKSLADDLITDYSARKRNVIVTVRGVPQLQLNDRIKIYDSRKGDYLYMKVIRIEGFMENNAYTQRLFLRERGPDTFPFIVGTHTVGSTVYLVQ